METAKLKKFAQYARRSLIEQVGSKLSLVLAAESSERRESPQTIAELEKQIAAQIDLALMLGVQDELDQAIAVLDAVLERDPLSLTALGRLSEIAARQGDCERLQTIYQRVERLDSGRGRYRWWQGYCVYARSGDAQKAFNFFQQESVDYARLTGSAIALHALGRKAEARAALERLMETSGDAASFQYVEVYAQWGDIDEAIRWLEYAREILDPGFMLINTDKLLDPIRGDSRFVAMQQTFNAGM